MKIATWNVNSIAARLPIVRRWLDAVGPDILCMQETKCADDRFPSAEFAELGYQSIFHGQRTYNGVAIISKDMPEGSHAGFPDDIAGAHARLIAGTFNGVQIINVYIPNGSFVGSEKYDMKLAWMRRLHEFIAEKYQRTSAVLLCGDFNVAPEARDVHDPRLWEGRIMCSEPERAALAEIRGWGFTDIFRVHTAEEGHFTWWDYRAGAFRRNMGLRIDHMWASDSMASRFKNCWIDKETRRWERPSDHAPVVAEL